MFEFGRGSVNVSYFCGAYSFAYIGPLGWKSPSIGQNAWADVEQIIDPK